MVLVTAFVCAHANAQVATVSATQTMVAVSSATGSNQFAPGPLPATGLTLQSPTGSITRSRIDIGPYSPSVWGMPPNSVGWSMGVTLNAFSALNLIATSSATGRIVVSFQAPQPMAGVLFLIPDSSAQMTSFVGDATLDVDGDGTPDAFARSQHGALEIPCTLGPTPFSITVDWNITGTMVDPSFWGAGGSGYVTWQMVFVASTYAIETYAPGCARLDISRSVYSQPALIPWLECTTYPGPDFVVGAFLIGISPQNTILQMTPFCPLLVASPIVVPPSYTLAQRQMGLSFPHYQLPPGLQVYGQAIWIDTSGALITTDAVRTR